MRAQLHVGSQHALGEREEPAEVGFSLAVATQLTTSLKDLIHVSNDSNEY